MLIFWCGFLLLTHFFCHGHPLECDTTKAYIYKKDDTKCCKKCAPGERMEKGCTKDSETVCKPCSFDFYMDEFSREMECKRCTQCTKEHMVYNVTCSKSVDAVCGCESGYQCSDKSCTNCEKIPTLPPTTRTTTTTIKTTTTAAATMKSAVISTPKNSGQPLPFSQEPHLHMDGSCWLQLVVFGGPRKLPTNPVSAQWMRKCQCQSRKCVDIKNGKKRSKGDRGKRRGQGRKRHIRVWIDYSL
ncbi:tumor necrosis factor receptor superfamily member 1B isoform X2 [Hemibagrus wyckioides]|uniref:tumor necrosis factor receptor superfamily member 1B isoform X2 n=1 Tax=Hemibagrus wyckioides TaxID=337641 RepID=UPI00266CC7C1|nr:tumor necrosis factor receptor superfamily member 1B isoform X2 [Hemibagrus wyckioides]